MKILLFLIIPFFVSAQSLRTKVNEGNEHYKSGEYEQAINKYKDALLDDPLHEVTLFNGADALFKMEKYKEAREEYQKILATKDLNLAAKAHFNIGNTLFKEDKLPESIKSYKKALDLAPNDYDAKYNLELAQAKLKEQSEKKQQNQDQNQQNQQQNQDQQKSDQNDENKENQQQEQQQQEDQQQQKQEKEEQDKKEQQEQQAQEAQQRKDEINKDEAERILNALKADEQKAQENKPPVKGSRRATGKDW